VTSRLEIPISITALARGFGCKRDRITSALSHGLEPPKTRGRHHGLSEDREQEIVALISKYAAKSRPITRRDLREHVAAEYGVPTTRGWVNSFIGRHIGALCFAKSSPQESQRLKIPRCFLEQTLACISQFVQGRPIELVFNLDEVRISEWEDRKPKKVLVPISMRGQTVHHKVNRNLKHVLVLACVSAAGESLMPYISTSQDSLHVRRELKKKGVRFGTNLILKARQKPYINAECFLDYIRRVFLPNLNDLRILEEFTEEDAILLMDNCLSHVGEEILSLLRDARVRITIWAPHTSHHTHFSAARYMPTVSHIKW
jgi:hypothetical protein